LVRPARFFCPRSLDTDSIGLDESESHHAVKVRRLGPQDPVEIFDGAGSSRRGVIETIARHGVRVAFNTPLKTEPPPDRTVTLFVSPARGERMAFAVEKLSEIGCDRLVPVLFSRSLDAGVRAATGRTAKWRRKAIEAAKQCGRNRIVDVADPVPIDQALGAHSAVENRFLLDVGDDISFLGDTLEKADLQGETVLIVGPEGGFTSSERSAIVSWGAEKVRLWQNILRIETAAVAAAALVQEALRVSSGGQKGRQR